MITLVQGHSLVAHITLLITVQNIIDFIKNINLSDKLRS